MQPRKKLPKSKLFHTLPKRLRSRLGWLHIITFCAVLLVSWVMWGKDIMRGKLDLVVDDSIDQSDGRIDYRLFQSVVSEINSHFAFPKHISFHIEPCDDANAYYDSGGDEIILCDELIDDFVGSFQQVYNNPEDVRDASTNAFVFIAVHELGHAMIDMLDLPITGKEEDVADQLSTYVLINSFENGAQFVLDGATWFGVTSEQYDLEEGDFADLHSLDVQRYYTLACWVYGSDTERYGSAVIEGGLPADRTKTCVDEYNRFTRSWATLLKDIQKG